MNILAINPGHNGSAALVADGKLEVYIEEERMSRVKRDGNPYKAMIWLMQKYTINYLIICGNGSEHERHVLPWTGENSYEALVRKFYPKVEVLSFGHMHHLLKCGNRSRSTFVEDRWGTVYLNAACVPRRVKDLEGNVIENLFILVEVSLLFESDKILFKFKIANLCPSVAADSRP